ncbi:MAG TPA: peptidoglycan DD-metalloendopeptidase family protein [Gemmatimonadales bacterium]|jgi:septal ring factor EnvC (AmiA/AmiB activator)|nr:peptidoglycan DD-metalloendopeptidase family protein [Gemmatimonadales bacterium]
MKRLLLLLVLVAAPAAAQRPTYQQQMQDNQRRLEGIRRERSEVEQELARLRTAAHSLSDELANIDRQKQSTNRIVNELDRQISGLGAQIDQITVDLLLAQDALLEKRAVLERRIVDIHKRGPLYGWQVLLAAESFGDLLSRYKYLYLVSRQDRLLTNDMHKLRDRVARQRQLLVDSRETLAHRRRERTDELDRYQTLERERQNNLRETRGRTRQAEQRLSQLDRDEKGLNDRIEALERARREAEARGASAGPGAITTADLGGLDWPVEGGGLVIYPFGTTTGPNNTRIPRHGIGIKAPVGSAVRVVAPGTVSLAGPLGLYLTSVLVDHGGGYYTFYAYLNDATVRQGDRVVRGQVIGHVGGESSDEGAHLHFEIRGQGGIALDPANWLRRPAPSRPTRPRP